MENSKGDQTPEKNLIGPSLPFSEAVLFDGQPDCQRYPLMNREMFGGLSFSTPSQEPGTPRLMRTNSDFCRELKGQLKGCFDGPALSSDFLNEDPVSLKNYFFKELWDKGLENSGATCSTMEEPQPAVTNTMLLETTTPEPGSPSQPPTVFPVDLAVETAPSLQELFQPQMFPEVFGPGCGISSTALLLPTSTPPAGYSPACGSTQGDDGPNRGSMNNLSLDPNSASTTPLLSQHALLQAEQAQCSQLCRDSIFEPGFSPAHPWSQVVKFDATPQAPTTATTHLFDHMEPTDATTLLSQPSSPLPMSTRDAGQIHIHVTGVNEMVVMVTEVEGEEVEELQSLMTMAPQSSCCQLVMEQPENAVREEEGGEKKEKPGCCWSGGCCFFSCMSSKTEQ